MVRTYFFMGGGAVEKGGTAPPPTDLSTEIKILRELSLLYDIYHTEKKYHTDINSLKTILVSQNNPTRQEMVPTACIDISTTQFIFASYFLRAVPLKNSRNLLRRF